MSRDWRDIKTAPRDRVAIEVRNPQHSPFGIYAAWWQHETHPGWYRNGARAGQTIGFEPTQWLPIGFDPTAPAGVDREAGVMKRYALFSWRAYEAGGGWNEFRDTYDSVEDARAAAIADTYCNRWQIIDLSRGQIAGED